MAAPTAIFDAGDADFESSVLERSREVPVVVDFWAPWCGPCRQLAPVLERLAEQAAGAFVLARINVDESPEVAARVGVRSIPLVIAFRDGAAVSEFTGAQPESAVRQFLAAVLPSEADQIVADAERLAAAGDEPNAEAGFRSALDRDARHPAALLGLARLLGARGDTAAAGSLLDRIVGASPAQEQAARELAAELRTGAGGETDTEALLAAVAAAPDDLGARLALGRALAAARRYDEALPELLAVVERDREFEDQAARKAMLDCFELLGAEHPLCDEYRSRLARALFR